MNVLNGAEFTFKMVNFMFCEVHLNFKKKKDTKQIGTGHLSYLYDDKEVIWEAHWFLEI